MANETKQKWKVGDFCLYAHDIYQIKEMDGDVITTVSDGIGIHAGRFDDQVFPLTLQGKMIAEFFHRGYKELHEKGGNLNWPQLSCKITELFTDAMKSYSAGQTVQQACSTGSSFFRCVWLKIAERNEVTVLNVKLFN